MTMCSKNNCERHELWGGLCLDHLKEKFAPKPKRRSRKKKVDAVEVETTDETSEMETRDEGDRQV